MRSLEEGCWKSIDQDNSLAAYPTSRPVLQPSRRGNYRCTSSHEPYISAIMKTHLRKLIQKNIQNVFRSLNFFTTQWSPTLLAMKNSRAVHCSIFVAITIWTTWLIATGPIQALTCLGHNWEIAVTMSFGSIVAGGTSMGGGAVAFPVLTKLLQIPAHDTMIFSLAIQSVGMGAATLTIISMGLRVEWRVIRWASIGSLLGIFWGTIFLAPILPSDVTKMSFTMMVSSFGVVLLIFQKQFQQGYQAMPQWSNQERSILLGVGFLGGIMSGLVGTGVDIFTFSVMVLLFRICETVSTPTSVILMAINAQIGFALHYFIINDFIDPVREYWLAAVPVVVVGAPVGAVLCSVLKPKTIMKILLGLICTEFVSSLVLIQLSPKLLYWCLWSAVLFSCLYYWMYRTKTYVQKRK